MTDGDQRTDTSLSLTTGGITLLGVLLSVGITVGFGISGPWWLRVAIGAATTVALTVLVKLGTDAGRGPLAKVALWIIGSGDKKSDG